MKNCVTLLLVALMLFECTRPVEIKSQEVANESFQSGFAPIGPLKLYYEIHGQGGMPLVLIHGGGSTIQTTFGNTLELFANDRQVIAVEIQAHGHTPDADRPLTFEQDADDVAALLDFLKIPKADILGFSNGGSTALQMAIRHPEKVNKIVPISGIYKREGMFAGFFDGMKGATIESMPKPLQEGYLKVTNNTQEGLQRMFERDRDRMNAFQDWPDESIQSIKIPALVVVGDHDVVTVEHAAQMSKLIANSSLLILPGNHGSFIGEICSIRPGSKMPELTVGMIKDFLDE
ncbi:MAG TPA: alpha/beta hydrolase [Cyclobacteriaceae bacterium]